MGSILDKKLSIVIIRVKFVKSWCTNTLPVVKIFSLKLILKWAVFAAFPINLTNIYHSWWYILKLKRHLCSCSECINTNFERCIKSENIAEVTSVPDEQIHDLDELDEHIEPDIYTFIHENLYVALYSTAKSLELFIVLKVIKKSEAAEDISDLYGHCIQKGSFYIEGRYLEKIEKKSADRSKVHYKELKKAVFVHPSEIFFQQC